MWCSTSGATRASIRGSRCGTPTTSSRSTAMRTASTHCTGPSAGPRSCRPSSATCTIPLPRKGGSCASARRCWTGSRATSSLRLRWCTTCVSAPECLSPDVIQFLLDRAPEGIIEWVDREDPMVKQMLRLRPDVYPDYTWPTFESILKSSRARADGVRGCRVPPVACATSAVTDQPSLRHCSPRGSVTMRLTPTDARSRPCMRARAVRGAPGTERTDRWPRKPRSLPSR